MWIRNGVLNARPGHADAAQLTVTSPKPALTTLLLKPGYAATTIDRYSLTTEGDTGFLATLVRVTDTFNPHFNLVTP
ncbi:alkyl sulfatase C-terminal domain-containing protein [Streptomyces sp. NPDC058486]|uniref:alkyl sulfatase C-terminal domain-containing protein n=1 Tax=unclassified Streptomyces TaxID=2593676 RepID=UPI00365D607C